MHQVVSDEEGSSRGSAAIQASVQVGTIWEVSHTNQQSCFSKLMSTGHRTLPKVCSLDAEDNAEKTFALIVPSGMREHPFMCTPLAAFEPETYPADPDVDFAKRPYDEDETWPSELGNGGRVGWRRFEIGEDGWLEISYPEVR